MARTPSDQDRLRAVLDIMAATSPSVRPPHVLMDGHLRAKMDEFGMTYDDLRLGVQIAIDRGYFTPDPRAPDNVWVLTDAGFAAL